VKGQGPFSVETETENFGAKAVVNATGRWSNLTLPTDATRDNGDRRIGLKAHYREASSPASVDLYFFDGGYCGVQPITDDSGEHAVNACAMVSAQRAKTIADVLQLHPELKERSRDWELVTRPVTTSPLAFHEPTPLVGGMLQVGDAATFVDPFVGDGISLALRSGALAAECLMPLLAGGSSLQRAAGEYAGRYQERLSHVFRASSVLRRILGWPSFVRRPLLTLVQKTPSLARQLVRLTR
jgi:flavin-dependent dehydrogenase